MTLQVGTRAQQREGQCGARDDAVAAQFGGDEAERHQGETGGRPPPAHSERKGLKADEDNGQRVKRACREVPDLSLVAAQHRQERRDDQQQREREIPDRDVTPPPQTGHPPEVDH
ncbi:hypothetical protein Raf01_96760 [Rugosimonospora africana]|uniref:Uncharacterized protein n=1 Tax=Rugosimonospora africana TaxID=556532 RepID=A0A8J3VX40_9ACTN|nr:hypothetical protein Raf01_96760 [Rugosimonospora africana]